MRIRELGWMIFLAGLPFANVVFPALSIWNAQTAWANGGILVLWACGWRRQQALPPCLPLGLFLSWAALSLWWAAIQFLNRHELPPLQMFMPLLHLAILVLAIQAAMTQWTKSLLTNLLKVLAWGAVIMSGYSSLQLLHMDQFLTDLHHKGYVFLVGTIGNPTHLASYFALALPCVLLQRGIWWKLAAGWIGVILLCTNSISGQLAAAVALWLCYWERPWMWLLVFGGALVALYLAWTHADTFNPNGRLAAWHALGAYFAQRPITGSGQGFILYLSTIITQGPLLQWVHAHNEFLQVAVENGLIGLGLLIATLIQWGKRARTLWSHPLGRPLIAIMGAFIIIAFLNFPAHLWALGIFGLVAFCGVFVLTEEGYGTPNPI